MHRFFSAACDLNGPVVKITDRQEIHHLTRVLRLRQGDRVTIFNGRGEEASGDIVRSGPRAVDVRLTSRKKTNPSRSAPVTLACAIPKKAKFETIIEKCTELGVDEIVPLITRRTIMRLDGIRARQKAERYRLVAVNAAKQCGRMTVPVIGPVTPFEDFIRGLDGGTCAAFIPYLEGERKELLGCLGTVDRSRKLVFLIGPEGDFTGGEVGLAVSNGCVPVSLGPTVLKVDTAAISVIALANFLRNKS